MNQTAIDSNVYIFPICYNNNCNIGQSPVQMNALAVATGGKFYTAATAAQLDGVFDAIYEKIMELAGEKTQMTLVFQDIEVNDQMYTGNQLYDYIPVNIPAGLAPGVVSDPSSVVDVNARSSIIWPNKTQSIVNQSDEWATNTLKFHVGAVGLNQVWETTFRLKVKKAGCYNVFGSESKIELDKEVRYLSDLTVCVFEDPENKEFQFGTLAVEGLGATPETDFKTVTWTTKYTSPPPSTNKATVTVSYRVEGSNSWKVLYTTTANPGDTPQTTTIDVRNFPKDKPIYIQVHATAPDAASVDSEISFILSEPYNPYYLIIE
jgi:hypothetical protein